MRRAGGRVSTTITDIHKAKLRQRHIFTLGVGAALIPILCQIVVAFVVFLAGKADFPKSDQTVMSLGFWDIQMVLLCIAVAANTMVDFGKLVIDKSVKKSILIVKIGTLIGLFIMLSICFSATILGSDVLSKMGVAMLILGAVILALSYVIDMDLALIEAGFI
jgi:hypothetical protein